MNRKRIWLIVLLIALVALVGCAQQNSSPEAETRVITDMAGRQVEIPAEINKVYSTSAIGSVFLYTLAPDKIAGWNDDLRDIEKQFIDPKYYDLPNLGRWKGSTPTGSIEDLLKAAPDIIISVGDVSPEYIGDTDDIQKQTGIPVVMLDGSLQNTAEAYRVLGDLIGETARAEELAAYCEQTLEEINSNLKALTEENKVRVYYGQGIEGLETEISGTVNSEAFDLAGAKNVAVPVGAEVRRMQVSIEQILTWDPELIIISTDGDRSHALYNKILTDKAWASITAVKNKEVYEIPSAPYDWINRPPSVVRFIGVKWLSSLLYPDIIDLNIREDIKEFYSLFFNYEITEAEIEELLATAERK
ncbi:MAG: ABC transporter substrate-binding protein [Peptococcaceae bacterium]|mgnify:FL=1|jgi:iron complex transport system substrate-binding protein|nr:ABC transporter substrate-binding protein [Peptococcaceae bacterium]